jgi:DNA-binding CsgD family transcriptional regulator
MPGPESLRAEVAFQWSSTLVNLLDQRDEARAMLQRTLVRLSEPGPRQRVIGTLLSDGLATVADVAADVNEDELSPGTAFGLAFDAMLRGRSAEAIERIDAALAIESAWMAELRTLSVPLRIVRVLALTTAGRPVEAETYLAGLYDDAVQMHADYPRGAWCLARGMVAAFRGTMPDAIDALLEADAALRTMDPNLLRPTYAYLAMAHAATRSQAAAADEVLATAQQHSRVLDHAFGSEVERAVGWVHAARGDRTAAQKHAAAAAAMDRDASAFVLEAIALHDVARFGDAGSVAARLADLAVECDGVLVLMFAEHARALVDGDAAALLELAKRFAASGFVLFGAEAAHVASERLRQEGRRASAHFAADTARELAAMCGEVTTPALELGEQPELTPREREIAVLAAQRRSSRAIAEQLGITTRTVDNLLGRVYVKLGVRGRDELIDVFDAYDAP